jgi:RNA polymerase sigma-70 factor (sigma-E family)
MAATPEFDDYVKRARSGLHWDAYHLCADWHEAEDLVQITLQKIFHRWDHLHGHDMLGAYTRRALLHSYISEHRQPRWSHEVSMAQPPDHGQPDTEPIEVGPDLRAALDGLGVRQRTVIMLRFWDDLSVGQAAAVMGCTPGTISSQTHRALARLRAALSPRPASPDAAQGRRELSRGPCRPGFPG